MKKDGVIFLLENSTDYLFLMDQGFRRSQIVNPLRVARYGNEAILYLKGVGIYSDRTHYPLPGLIIIDLAVPDGSGLAVLGWIRRQEEFNNVPVIILVDPDQNKTLQDAFDRGANAYYIKRNDLDGLARMIRCLETVREVRTNDHTSSRSKDEISAE
ncbi:MAG TPA: response regulator [Verrucomicrobiae bacterium]